MNDLSQLLAKYDVPVPRYTSYPTVPYWQNTPSSESWLEHLRSGLAPEHTSFSLYIHVPYCETLCTFCGCNNIITKDHSQEDAYVELVIREMDSYLLAVPDLARRKLKLIHLGGGSPTFLSPQSLEKLLRGILGKLTISPTEFEGAIEVDPRRTTREQLEVMRKFGFNRISLGVQDFDPEVQRLVNRIQPFSITKNISDVARSLGFDSVNFDLIYGLARQTPESIRKSAELTAELRPDRIALYSFAMVPWIKPQQRLFKDEELPAAPEKRKLYEIAREVLVSAGYVEIGMDHFALPNDGLALAAQERRLHRNFMGYTDQYTEVLLGLGVSAISETPQSFHQNEKVFPVYRNRILAEGLATLRGHTHDQEDLERRKQILELMTTYQVKFLNDEQHQTAKAFLSPMIEDGLVFIDGHLLKVTDSGKPFLRNVCVFFDERLRRQQPSTQVFSKSI